MHLWPGVHGGPGKHLRRFTCCIMFVLCFTLKRKQITLKPIFVIVGSVILRAAAPASFSFSFSSFWVANTRIVCLNVYPPGWSAFSLQSWYAIVGWASFSRRSLRMSPMQTMLLLKMTLVFSSSSLYSQP